MSQVDFPNFSFFVSLTPRRSAHAVSMAQWKYSNENEAAWMKPQTERRQEREEKGKDAEMMWTSLRLRSN